MASPHAAARSAGRPDPGRLVVVSGIPRSGTSLMMQMLAAGGLPVFADASRPPDPDNPRGYFEHAAVRATERDPGWVSAARGRAVKVIFSLLSALPSGPRYDVILMRRPIEEVLASQARMLARRGAPPPPEADRALAPVLERRIREVAEELAHAPGFRLLEVGFAEVLRDPVAVAARVDAFLGGGLDRRAMVAAVEPALSRSSASRPD